MSHTAAYKKRVNDRSLDDDGSTNFPDEIPPAGETTASAVTFPMRLDLHRCTALLICQVLAHFGCVRNNTVSPLLTVKHETSANFVKKRGCNYWNGVLAQQAKKSHLRVPK